MAYDATDFVVTEVPAPITQERANMLRVRDTIAGLSCKMFDMSESGEVEDAERGSCDTAACIGGWARAVLRRRVNSIYELGPYLGLTEPQARTLFYPGVTGTEATLMSDGESPYDASPHQAVRVLDHYLATGEINWAVA